MKKKIIIITIIIAVVIFGLYSWGGQILGIEFNVGSSSVHSDTDVKDSMHAVLKHFTTIAGNGLKMKELYYDSSLLDKEYSDPNSKYYGKDTIILTAEIEPGLFFDILYEPTSSFHGRVYYILENEDDEWIITSYGHGY